MRILGCLFGIGGVPEEASEVIFQMSYTKKNTREMSTFLNLDNNMKMQF